MKIVPGLAVHSLECPRTILELSRLGRARSADLTVKRYSTARSGLKKAARMARSMSALAKPMLSMLAIAASRSPPMVRAEGSLNWRNGSAACCAGAGEGVAGAFCVVVNEGAGAAGATGVWAAGGGAGVEGAALLEDAADAFGCCSRQ